MSEHGHGHAPAHGEGFDREIGFGAIRWFVIGLVILSIFSFALGWVVSRAFKAGRVKDDPAASPIPEANQTRPRPRAALQANPVADMEAFRAHEEKVLTSYAWVDKGAGIARIPVDRALDLIADKGLPATPPLPAAPATTAPAGGK